MHFIEAIEIMRVLCTNCDLRRLKTTRLQGRYCTFESCDLAQSRFSSADLMGSKFIDCDLSKANFQRADLTWVTFEGCDMAKVKFKGANFSAMYFKRCRNLDLEALSLAKPGMGGINLEDNHTIGEIVPPKEA